MQPRYEQIVWITVYGEGKAAFRKYLDPNNQATETRLVYTHIMMRVDSATNQLVPLTRENAYHYRFSHNYSLTNSDFFICFEASVSPIERFLCKELVEEQDDIYREKGVYIPCEFPNEKNERKKAFDNCHKMIMASLYKQEITPEVKPEISIDKEKSILPCVTNTNNEETPQSTGYSFFNTVWNNKETILAATATTAAIVGGIILNQ